ncbi:MAG TPA: hypothetical protein VHK88_13050 [Aquihabitans sp.]|jgi:hypothetical protein|nr:hypothetical protein [Aquihabitans sp.]
MTDAAPPPERSPASAEVDIDVAAFLPEGSALAAVDETDPASLEAADGDTADVTDGDVSDGPAPDPEPVAAPASQSTPARPSVDLAALERIEADLAAVDGALVAIDAGEPASSPLLAELLGDDDKPD